VDNVTHTLTGLMMARAGLGKKVGRGGTLLLLLSVNAPDMDVLWSGLPGGLKYFEHHRGITHSLVLAPLVAIVPLLLARWIRKTSICVTAYLASVLGVLSHVLMDTTNVYGVRLLLPFSSRWFRLDTVNIVDPWLLLIFALAVGAPALAGLISSEIAGRKSGPPTRAWAWFAIWAILGYEGFRAAAHQRAIAVMSARLYGTADTPRYAAIPDLINPLRWRGMVITDEFVVTTNLLLTEEYDPAVFGHIDYPTRSSAAIDAAKTTGPFRVMEQFDQLPFWKVSPAGEAILVELIDLRFGTPREPGFATASALVDPDGHVKEARLGVLGFQ